MRRASEHAPAEQAAKKSRTAESAPSASAPSDAAASLSSLPLDAVAHLLSFVPLRPRLLVASLVCKAWRRAALECPASIACLQTGADSIFPYETVAKHLPNVVEMIAGPDVPYELFPRLNSLELAEGCASFCKKGARSVTSLTALSLESTARECGCKRTLIQANRGLVHLSINLDDKPFARLPSLTSLHLPVDGPHDKKLAENTHRELLATHAAQLTSLSAPFALAKGHTFPKLTSASVQPANPRPRRWASLSSQLRCSRRSRSPSSRPSQQRRSPSASRRALSPSFRWK